MTRWRGLKDLVVDAVHHGSIAVEQVQQQVARKPLDLLAHVPLLAAPARRVSSMQSALIASTYCTIRGVTRLVGSIAGLALELVAAERERPAGAHGWSQRRRRK